MPDFRVTAYDRDTVVARLVSNLEQHQYEVSKLKKKRAKALAKEFRKQADKADRGHQTAFSWTSQYPAIIDYTDQYEQAIDRFKSQKDDTVMLTDQEFNQYMRNEWSWSRSFMASASSYAG